MFLIIIFVAFVIFVGSLVVGLQMSVTPLIVCSIIGFIVIVLFFAFFCERDVHSDFPDDTPLDFLMFIMVVDALTCVFFFLTNR